MGVRFSTWCVEEEKYVVCEYMWKPAINHLIYSSRLLKISSCHVFEKVA